jgi:hypothetical protein
MKRKMFFALSLILVLFSLEAKASTPRTTLQYYIVRYQAVR